ncbi:MAG: DUF3307 domain-containing protein [Rhodanobacteraceae bacterium]|nr:DUF3307 domain-containing protein [Rhodanobacteraceae bacterium]
MFTASQFVAHLVGDYVIQSDWMASEKTKQNQAALAHALTYTLPFLLLSRSPLALGLIAASHFVIDRWRLARYVCWAKNWLAPRWISTCDCEKNPQFSCSRCNKKLRNHPWEACQGTGYGPDKPAWLAVWLLIIADNTMHLCCNALALHYLGGS